MSNRANLSRHKFEVDLLFLQEAFCLSYYLTRRRPLSNDLRIIRIIRSSARASSNGHSLVRSSFHESGEPAFSANPNDSRATPRHCLLHDGMKQPMKQGWKHRPWRLL